MATVTQTVEELDALLADDTYDTCSVVSMTIRLFGWTWRRQDTPCRRRAVAMIVITCSDHGRFQRPVCAKHLRMMRRLNALSFACCPTCGQRAEMTGDA